MMKIDEINSVMTKTWRPLTAVSLVGIVISEVLGYVNIPIDIQPQIIEITQWFILTYAGGRSLEKIADILTKFKIGVNK